MSGALVPAAAATAAGRGLGSGGLELPRVIVDAA